ncbi:MAG: tetratricopeptide repeat protein [Burkholderiales bacterium]|jgi:Tfp pilus assembly protein PilF
MSLLLQALQKAARNRDDNTDNSSVSNDERDDLSLEPLAEPQLAEQTRSGNEDNGAPVSSPDDAADVMRASEPQRYTAIDWARDHYMLTFLSGAALFAILYGLYVYIQISSPGMFRSTPAPASAPVMATAMPAPTQKTDTELPRISGLPDATATAPSDDMQQGQVVPDNSEVASPVKEAATPTARPARTSPTPVAASPKPSSPVKRTTATAAQRAPSKPASARGISTKIDKDGVEVVEIPLGPRVAAISEGTQPPANEGIAVRAEDPVYSRIDPVLMMAYEALQRGDYEKATVLYSEVLSRMPESTDAMLGLGAIAWKQGRPGVASQYYGRVLEVEPRNTHAQAGLIAILGNADPVAAETRLKQLIDREPSGFLYFTLGNLYAQRNLWAQAQQAYFRAFQLQPGNSDYAFNLAVGLEHLGKERPALDYYRKALDLSFKNGRANFDQELAIERVGQLSARVE